MGEGEPEMKNDIIENYQEAIVKIYISALHTFRRPVGREIFISMLKGRKDSKIVKGKYYENEYYGIFGSFKGNEVSNILDYLIEENIIGIEIKGNVTFVYPNKNISDLYRYYYDFIGYIADNSINVIDEKDEMLFCRLKDIRYGLALKEKLSPHNICSDKILREMCIKKPQNEEEMDAIYGIGEKFLLNYAKEFLEALNNENIFN